jgi:hypothetical protein
MPEGYHKNCGIKIKKKEGAAVFEQIAAAIASQ